MASTITQKFASSGFSVSRIEVTSVLQPRQTQYFLSNGVETKYRLEKEVELGLTGVQSIRIYKNGFAEMKLDNVEGDASFANDGDWYYDPGTSFTNSDGQNVNASFGHIVFKNAPTAGDTLKVVYFINPLNYAEYEDGLMRNLARDLTLHPYANDYSPAWTGIDQEAATLTITGATTVGQSSADLGDVDFNPEDIGSRIRERYGRGIAEITAVTGGVATVNIVEPFTDTVNGLDTDTGNGVYQYPNWMIVIAQSDVEPQPYNLIYPYVDAAATSSIPTDAWGQQNHTDVMTAIRRIGNLFVVESEKATDLLSSKADINSATSPLPVSMTLPQPVKETRKPQKWRIRFYYDEKDDYLHVNVGTKFQILDTGDITRGQTRDGNKKSVFRLPGELSEVYFDGLNNTGKSKAPFFRRQGKTETDVNNTYPITYRLTCTDHGTGLFIYDQASVDQDDDYAWFVIQRHVNNVSGKIEFEDGKSPVHCVYSPSKRPVEASEINRNFYSMYDTSIDLGTSPIQTTGISAPLDNIYNITGRKLKPNNEVEIKIITDKNPIPVGSYGSSVNYAGSGAQTLAGGAPVALTAGSQGPYVDDYASINRTMATSGTGVVSYDDISLDNYDKAFNDKLGPASMGLLATRVTLIPDSNDPDSVTELREGIDYEIRVDSLTGGVYTHVMKFFHVAADGVTPASDTTIAGVSLPTTTTGTPTPPVPKVKVEYVWKGAGYNNVYLNPYGRSKLINQDESAFVEEANRLQLLVEGSQLAHARFPYEYSISSDGTVVWPFDADFQGTSLNSYVYSITQDAAYVRNAIEQGVLVTIKYQNYAEDPDANNLYLIEIPEDPDFPNVWSDIHRSGKGIYRFIVRESDVLKPWDTHVSAVISQIDSPAIINPLEQLSITQDKTFVFNFPTPMASQRYIYPNSELDIICYSGADSSTEGGITNVGTTASPKYDLDLEQDSSVDGVTAAGTSSNGDPLDFRAPYDWHTGVDSDTTAANRIYCGMQSTKPNGNGMRIFVLVRGGPIRPEYSDWQVRL